MSISTDIYTHHEVLLCAEHQCPALVDASKEPVDVWNRGRGFLQYLGVREEVPVLCHLEVRDGYQVRMVVGFALLLGRQNIGN